LAAAANARFGLPVSRTDVVAVDQIDTNADNGLIISLPAPPVPAFDLPEIADSAKFRDYCISCNGNDPKAQILMDRARIKILMARIRAKSLNVDDHKIWLEEAQRAVERLKKQINVVTRNRDGLQEELDRLTAEKDAVTKRAKRDQLEGALANAKRTLIDLTRESSDLESAHSALKRATSKVHSKLTKYGNKLKLDKSQLLDKLQAFKDDANELAQIARPDFEAHHDPHRPRFTV